ncbi:MAG: phospho-sugar mutase [Clostridiales bacterium]|nr:phospho-sugar mutase [Clostridiales bacterium]
MKSYREEYENWLTNPVFDEETRKEVAAMKDEKEIEDAFYRQLSFGTGGLRGVIGAGTNRMNIYTVGKASQGLANFINSKVKNGSVAIAYDSRRMSPEFALSSALIFAANGIKAYLFESLRPTPELSFAIRHYHTTAGIVITASHNPPQYNGYKAYWSDGAQLVPPYDELVIEEVNKIENYADIKRIGEEEAKAKGLLQIIGKETDDAYIAALKKLVLDKDVIKKMAKDIRIVYTPFHGTGNVPVRRMLKELGFTQVWVVPEQEEPDGNFTTLDYPNPEDPKAFTLALALAKKVDADIVLATDPDADRLGVYAKDTATGEYMTFTGNMSGLLICEYELSRKREMGLLPEPRENGALVTTIVSSNMAFAIAKEYGITAIEVLTGFKYIGEQIKNFEEAKAANGGKYDAKKGAYEYLFGYEESYGCLVGTHARDKDAVMAVTALCEAAAYYKSKGMTLWDQMQAMYKKYGYFKESLETISLPGSEGAAKITEIMNGLRACPPENIGGEKVLAARDYLSGERFDTVTGKKEKLTLPKSNVLYYELEEAGWCCARPSGTEPKIKFYFGVKGYDAEDAARKVAALKKGLMSFVKE